MSTPKKIALAALIGAVLAVAIKKAVAVTVLGFVLLVVVAVSAACIIGALAMKALDALKTVQAQHEKAITNAMDVAQSVLKLPAGPLFIDSPEAVWTDLSNGLVQVEIPDNVFAQAVSEYREWAILASVEAAGPYADTGDRKWGNPYFIKTLLHDRSNLEGPVAPYEAHLHVQNRFFKAIPVEELPLPVDPK